MKMNRGIVPSALYIVLTFLMVFLQIAIPEICHFMGASSMIYAFLFAVGSSQRLLAFIALAWIPILIVSLIVLFVVALKKNRYLPFNIVVACDLLISILIIGSKIKAENYSDLGIALVGYAIRLGYFFWMLYFTKNARST